jgi:hypothetical protein
MADTETKLKKENDHLRMALGVVTRLLAENIEALEMDIEELEWELEQVEA